MRGEIMEKRRKFLKTAIGFLAGVGFLFSPFYKAVRIVYGKGQKIILPRNTKTNELTGKDPRDLDTRNLEITPLKDFGTMGESNYEMNMETWRLDVTGRVGTPLTLTYAEILARPPLEKSVLLICPGVFANHGRWKGISMGKLLEEAKIGKDLTHVTF